VATSVSEGIFEALEKPLVLEIIAPGLVNGLPVFEAKDLAGKPVTLRCWDNVHLWGSRGPGAPLISAPGAFHCAHMHWRWGAAAKPAGQDKRFNPGIWPDRLRSQGKVNGMWGPLVDPAIWIQTIRIAVTKNDPRLDPDRVGPGGTSTKDWSAAFMPGLRPVPEDISQGEDIVLWYSAEIHRELTYDGETFQSASGGTVFIHGIFFAHDAE
jgi:hypothetical protein